MRSLRRSLSPQEREVQSLLLCQRIAAWHVYNRAGRVLFYYPTAGEISLIPLIQRAWAEGKQVALPRVEQDGCMSARLYAPGDVLPLGAYAIPAPSGDAVCFGVDELDLVLAPGTAFDVQGNRLGQGGGYYDRYLAGGQAIKAGVGYDFQLIATVPEQAHDIKMNAVFTPGTTVQIGGNESEKEG